MASALLRRRSSGFDFPVGMISQNPNYHSNHRLWGDGRAPLFRQSDYGFIVRSSRSGILVRAIKGLTARDFRFSPDITHSKTTITCWRMLQNVGA